MAGSGEWGRDAAPYPHPFTTIAGRPSHLSEMPALRADHTAGGHVLTRDDYPISATTTEATALLGIDDAVLDTVGYCTRPHGSDADEPFLDVAWRVSQELVHHGAEIALLRDLHRARHH